MNAERPIQIVASDAGWTGAKRTIATQSAEPSQISVLEKAQSSPPMITPFVGYASPFAVVVVGPQRRDSRSSFREPLLMRHIITTNLEELADGYSRVVQGATPYATHHYYEP